jgi:peptide deformylase
MKLSIITEGDPRLRLKSAGVKKADLAQPKFQKFVRDLTETMYQADGIGIAAPQVGQNIRMIIVAGADGAMTMINPVITRRSWRKAIEEEGCLSVPGVYGLVSRSVTVSAQWLDDTGQLIKVKAEGLLARVLQHEIDHLDGMLFIDRTKKTYQAKPGEAETKL